MYISDIHFSFILGFLGYIYKTEVYIFMHTPSNIHVFCIGKTHMGIGANELKYFRILNDF